LLEFSHDYNFILISLHTHLFVPLSFLMSELFCHDYAVSEVGIKKLRHALKILSETEKQLRTSRNQATWVTVALLQFGSTEPNLVAEPNDMHAQSITGYTGKHNKAQYHI